MKTKNSANCQKSYRGSTIARNQTQSNSTEVVGNKTHAALEQDWLNHFKSTEPQLRKEGWFTVREMADNASVKRQTMARYLASNQTKYDSMKAVINLNGVRNVVLVYKFKK